MLFPFLARNIDERFLMHRLRSTSIAGVIGAVMATLLFAWHFYVDHVWNWELLSIGLTVVVIKLSLLFWYRFTD